jgi:hypothetical protein
MNDDAEKYDDDGDVAYFNSDDLDDSNNSLEDEFYDAEASQRILDDGDDDDDDNNSSRDASSQPRKRQRTDDEPATSALPLSEARRSYNEASQKYRDATLRLVELEQELERARDNKMQSKKSLQDTTDQLLPDLLAEDDDEWNKMYRILLKFKEKRGHVRVSRVKNTKEGLANEPYLDRLGMWVYQQRSEYRRGRDNPNDSGIEHYKVKALETLGFNWDLREEKWDMRFEQLTKYKEENGHCNVPSGIRYKKEGATKELIELERWSKFQKNEYSKYTKGITPCWINESRIQKLRDLGFELGSALDTTWQKQYDKFKEFCSVVEHCYPKAVVGTDSFERWVETQLSNYKENKLDEDSVQKLKDLGLDVTQASKEFAKEVAWYSTYEALKACKKLYKNYCQLMVSPKNQPDNFDLYKWSCEQRDEYQKFSKGEILSLNQDKVDKLNAFGFEWESSSTAILVEETAEKDKDKIIDNPDNAEWMRKYSAMQAFHMLFGHSEVPQDMTCVKTAGTRDRFKLYPWSRALREEYKSYKEGDKDSILTTERVKLLDDMNFKWDHVEEEQRSNQRVLRRWTKSYEALQAFYLLYGHCLVPKGDDNRHDLYEFCKQQRRSYLLVKGKETPYLTKDMMNMLNKLNFVWDRTQAEAELSSRVMRLAKIAVSNMATNCQNCGAILGIHREYNDMQEVAPQVAAVQPQYPQQQMPHYPQQPIPQYPQQQMSQYPHQQMPQYPQQQMAADYQHDPSHSQSQPVYASYEPYYNAPWPNTYFSAEPEQHVSPPKKRQVLERTAAQELPAFQAWNEFRTKSEPKASATIDLAEPSAPETVAIETTIKLQSPAIDKDRSDGDELAKNPSKKEDNSSSSTSVGDAPSETKAKLNDPCKEEETDKPENIGEPGGTIEKTQSEPHKGEAHDVMSVDAEAPGAVIKAAELLSQTALPGDTHLTLGQQSSQEPRVEEQDKKMPSKEATSCGDEGVGSQPKVQDSSSKDSDAIVQEEERLADEQAPSEKASSLDNNANERRAGQTTATKIIEEAKDLASLLENQTDPKEQTTSLLESGKSTEDPKYSTEEQDLSEVPAASIKNLAIVNIDKPKIAGPQSATVGEDASSETRASHESKPTLEQTTPLKTGEDQRVSAKEGGASEPPASTKQTSVKEITEAKPIDEETSQLEERTVSNKGAVSAEAFPLTVADNSSKSTQSDAAALLGEQAPATEEVENEVTNPERFAAAGCTFKEATKSNVESIRGEIANMGAPNVDENLKLEKGNVETAAQGVSTVNVDVTKQSQEESLAAESAKWTQAPAVQNKPPPSPSLQAACSKSFRGTQRMNHNITRLMAGAYQEHAREQFYPPGQPVYGQPPPQPFLSPHNMYPPPPHHYLNGAPAYPGYYDYGSIRQAVDYYGGMVPTSYYNGTILPQSAPPPPIPPVTVQRTAIDQIPAALAGLQSTRGSPRVSRRGRGRPRGGGSRTLLPVKRTTDDLGTHDTGTPKKTMIL